MCGKQSAKFRKFSCHLSGAGTFTQILKREFERSRVKAEIFQLIEKLNGRTIYKSDVLTEQHGHIILRLPLAHCELNPIELYWAQVKAYVATHNKTFKDLAHDGLKVVTANHWQRCCCHVWKVVEELLAKRWPY